MFKTLTADKRYTAPDVKSHWLNDASIIRSLRRKKSEWITGLYGLSLAVVGSRAGIYTSCWNELSIKRPRFREIQPSAAWASRVCCKDKWLKSRELGSVVDCERTCRAEHEASDDLTILTGNKPTQTPNCPAASMMSLSPACDPLSVIDSRPSVWTK